MVSVIIPTYRANKYLYEALESALAQDVHKEILVIDDCADDDAPEKLKAYLEKHYTRQSGVDGNVYGNNDDGPAVLSADIEKKRQQAMKKTRFCFEYVTENTRIRIYQNRANLGVAVVRNIGTVLAEGEYIAFLDSDDKWLEGKLKKQLKAISESGACMCNTARELIFKDGRAVGNIIHTPERITLKMLEKTNYINCSSVVIRRDIMLKYPMRYSNVHEDYFAWLGILKECGFAVGVDEPLMLYRLSEQGKSRNKIKAAGMTFRTYRYAGYSLPRSIIMMFSYTFNGLRKYHMKNIRV